MSLKVPSSNGVSWGPNITAFHCIILFSPGAPLTPSGGSSCSLLKSRINRLLAAVDIFLYLILMSSYQEIAHLVQGLFKSLFLSAAAILYFFTFLFFYGWVAFQILCQVLQYQRNNQIFLEISLIKNHELQIYLCLEYFFCCLIFMWHSCKTGDCLIFGNLHKT